MFYRLMASALMLMLTLTLGCSDEAPGAPLPDTSHDVSSPTVDTSPEDVAAPSDTSTAEDVTPLEEDAGDAGIAPSLFTTIDVQPNPKNTLSALVHVETNEAVSVQIAFHAEGVGPFLTGATETGSSHDLVVVGMRQETTYTFTLQADVNGEIEIGPEVTFTTGKVPGTIPEFEVTVHKPELVTPGITLFGLATDTEDPNEPLYLAVDEAGEIVWYYNDLDADHNLTDREARLLPDGRILLSMKSSYRLIDPAGNTLGEIIGGPDVGGGLHHDAVLLDNGNFVTLTTEQQTINVPELGGDALLRGDKIVELDANNDVLWTWSSFDHLDTQSFPGQLAKKKNKKKGDYDWTHANALQALDGGDALLMSLRHQHEVLKINRATGEIEWRLGPFGDFELTQGEWFYAQHAPELHDDGRIFIYDNGNERPNSPLDYTRGVMYQLDFDAMTATQLWSYTCPEYGSFLGDIDLLESGNVLVTNGGIRLQGPQAPPGDGRLLEVTQEDEPKLVWELRASEAFIYRSERISSFWP